MDPSSWMGFTSGISRVDGGVLDLPVVLGGVGINVGGNGNSRISWSSVLRVAREDLRDRLDVLLVVRGRACACDCDCFVRGDERVVSDSEVEIDWEAPDETTTDSAWPVPSTWTPRGKSERLIASKSSTQSSKSSSTTVVKPSAPFALIVGC